MIKRKEKLLIKIMTLSILLLSGWFYEKVLPVERRQDEGIVTEKESLILEESIVTRVVDGDTIEVMVNNKKEKIRIIGVDSPETVDPRKEVECFGQKAAEFSKKKLEKQKVWLEKDESQGDRDKYGRLLRYVWINEKETDFGKLLIASGFAYEYTYDRGYRYQKDYQRAQREAEDKKTGLWADGVCD